MTLNPLVVLENITKVYQSSATPVAALKDVSLTIAEREFVCIMGASGSGKSTLLNVIGCLTRPTTGNYFLDGENISQVSRDQLAQIRNTKIGFVFQQFNLLPRFNARLNIEVPLIYAGYAPSQRKKLALDVLASLGLKDRARHWPTQLSGGEQQRVAIGRALVTRPKLILADEPTGNLDSRAGREVMEIFKKLNQASVTILLVTHEASNTDYAHRVITLKDGQLHPNGFRNRLVTNEKEKID